jgi:hypothetical protein
MTLQKKKPDDKDPETVTDQKVPNAPVVVTTGSDKLQRSASIQPGIHTFNNQVLLNNPVTWRSMPSKRKIRSKSSQRRSKIHQRCCNTVC